MQANIRKMSSERLRVYLMKAGRDEDDVMTWDRNQLMEEWALEIGKEEEEFKGSPVSPAGVDYELQKRRLEFEIRKYEEQKEKEERGREEGRREEEREREERKEKEEREREERKEKEEREREERKEKEEREREERKEKEEREREERKEKEEREREERKEKEEREEKRREEEKKERKEKEEREKKERKEKEERERKEKQEEQNVRDSLASRTKRYSDALKNILWKFPSDPIEIPGFFDHLDGLFNVYEVDKDVRAKLLLAILSERAKALTMRLTEAQLNDYKFLKEFLLREFKISPSNLRARFWSLHKASDESFTIYSSKLRVALMYYLKSRKITDEFDKLVSLLVADRLKESLSKACLDYILAQEKEEWLSCEDIANAADIYVASHDGGNDLVYRSHPTPKYNNWTRGQPHVQVNNQTAQPKSPKPEVRGEAKIGARVSQEEAKVKGLCFLCHQKGHMARECQTNRSAKKVGTCMVGNPTEEVIDSFVEKVNVLHEVPEQVKQGNLLDNSKPIRLETAVRVYDNSIDGLHERSYINVQIEDLPSQPALSDSGAEICCIDKKLIESLNLPVIKRINIIGFQGEGCKADVVYLQMKLANSTEGTTNIAPSLCVMFAVVPELNERVILTPHVVDLLRDSSQYVVMAVDVDRSVQINEEIDQLKMFRNEQTLKLSEAQNNQRLAENKIGELESSCMHLREDLNEAVSQFRVATQEHAHLEEKLILVERSLTSTQKKLSQKVGETAKLENSHRKLQTELRTMKERNSSYEDELVDQKQMIDNLRKDLLLAKEETHQVIQEMMSYKQNLATLECAYEGEKESQRQLNDQLTQQDQFLTQLQQDISAKSLQHQDTMKQLQLTKKMVAELQDEIDLHQKRDRETGNKLHEAETMIIRLRDEHENIHQRIRTLKEDIVDRDGQLHVSKMNLDTAHKQMQHLQQQVARYEELIAQLKSELEKSQSQHSNSHSQLLESQQQVHDRTVQLSTLQGNHKKTMDQLAEKLRQVVILKTELDRANQKAQSLAEEIASYEGKMKRLKLEQTKLQEWNRQNEDDEIEFLSQKPFTHFQNFQREEMLRRLQSDFTMYKEKHSHENGEFFEEENVIHQVEFEAEQVRSELQLKLHQLQDMSDSVKDLKKELNSQRDQKKHLEDQMNQLEKVNEEVILDRASSHQMFKSEKVRLKEQMKQLTSELTEANHKIRILEQEIAKRDDQLSQMKVPWEQKHQEALDRLRDDLIKATQLHTNDFTPKRLRAYKVPELLKPEVQHQIEEMWTLALQEFGVDFRYRPGRQNTVADFLSRL